MSKTITSIIKNLKLVSYQFDAQSGEIKKDLLKKLSLIKYAPAKWMYEFQHLLIFLAAHSIDEEMYHLVLKEKNRLAKQLKKMKSNEKLKFKNSGLPFTPTISSFTHDLLKKIASLNYIKLSFESFDETDIDLNTVLSFTLPDLEKDWSCAGYSGEELLDVLKIKKSERHIFILNELDKLNNVPYIKDFLLSKLYLNFRIEPLSEKVSKLYNKLSFVNNYYQTDKIKNIDYYNVINQPLTSCIKLNNENINEIVNVMQTSLFLLERETDPCTFIDVNSLRYYELGRGVSIAIFGMIPERQLAVESYVGYTLFKNGYPSAYGGAWIFGSRALFGINIFEQFRGGESSYLFCQILRTYSSVFNVKYFEVEPYQYGLDNAEGIDSGAFWFYYKFGFQPIDKSLNKLAKEEMKKIKSVKNYKSNKSVLLKFTESNISLQLTPNMPVSIALFRKKVTEMITKEFNGNRVGAVSQSTIELTEKTGFIPQGEDQKKVFIDLALMVKAFNIKSDDKLKLIKQLVEFKPTDLYKYNVLLSEFNSH